MDRHRGSGRVSSNSHYSSSEYSSRNYGNQNQQHHRGRGGWVNRSNNFTQSKDYDNKYSSDRGNKRRYDHSGEHRKSYDNHGCDDEAPRKYYRSNSNHSIEGRSNHHSSQYAASNSSSGRGRYNNYDNGRQSSQASHDGDSYQAHKRFDENRRFQPRNSGNNHRGGYIPNRGRGRARGLRGQGATPYHFPNKSREYRSERTDSRSPARSPDRQSGNGSTHGSEVSGEKREESRQPESNHEDDSGKAVRARSESGISTRDDNDREKGGTNESVSEHGDDDSKKKDDEENSESGENGRKTETERAPRKTNSKEPPEHFIRLQCPHCHQRSVTFRDYVIHLSSKRHAESLEKVSLQHRMSLAKLRTRQRKEQLQIEAQSSRPQHNSRMNFCAICKLYHSESRPNHETTELHKIIKNFLMPYCPICRVNFKSRMLYEKHVATLPHIRNKVNMEKTYERRREEEKKQDKSGQEKEEIVLDLENFMTLDAVGSVDGDAENGPSLEEMPVGQDCVKKVEAFFCDLCQRYLSRIEPLEKVLEIHCRTRGHHRAFEEHQNSGKQVDSQDEHEQMEESQTKDKNEEENLRRSESQERLLVEAEQDIGEMCDLIGDDGQAPEEEVDQQMEEHEEELGNDGEPDVSVDDGSLQEHHDTVEMANENDDIEYSKNDDTTTIPKIKEEPAI